MNFKVFATVLFIAALGIGFVGCSTYNRYDDPHSFHCETTMMDDVLKAAVRHNCLPQVLTHAEVMCTSVQDPTNILVKITLSKNSVIIANVWKPQSFKDAVNDYNKKIAEYKSLSDELKNNKNLTKELKSMKKESLKKLEKALDKQLNIIERLQKKYSFPNMEEYNAWVHAFEDKIQAETNRRISQD